MKLSDITIGKTYYVRIPRDVDEFLWLSDSAGRPRAWARVHIVAEVLEVGVRREVIQRSSLGGIAGSPRVRINSTFASDGVRIKFTDRHQERIEIVPPRSIQWEETA